MAGGFQAAIDALTNAPTATWKFDEGSGSFLDNSGTYAFTGVSGTREWYNAPGVIRDADEHGVWYAPLAQGMPSLGSGAVAAFDATGWDTGAFAFAFQLGSDEGDNIYIWELQYGATSVNLEITLTTSRKLKLDMSNGTDRIVVETTSALSNDTPYFCAIVQRGDTNDIQFRINGSAWAKTDVTRTGTGVGADKWISDVFATNTCNEQSLNNLDRSGSNYDSEFMVFQRPMVWVNNPPTNDELDSLYTACNFDGNPINLFQQAYDIAAGTGLHNLVFNGTVDASAPNSEWVYQYYVDKWAISTHSGGLRTGAFFSGTTEQVDPDQGDTNTDYFSFSPNATPIQSYINTNTGSNYDTTETAGTWMLAYDFDDGAPASDKSICGVSGNGSTNYCDLGIDTSGQLYWHFHDGTNAIKRTCTTPLTAGYHVVGIVQDGVDAKLYVDGEEQSVTDSGLLDGSQWISDLIISGTIRGFHIGAGGLGSSTAIEKGNFGVFCSWDKALSADDVTLWYESVVNATFVLNPFRASTKTKRRTGRRMYTNAY